MVSVDMIIITLTYLLSFIVFTQVGGTLRSETVKILLLMVGYVGVYV